MKDRLGKDKADINEYHREFKPQKAETKKKKEFIKDATKQVVDAKDTQNK